MEFDLKNVTFHDVNYYVSLNVVSYVFHLFYKSDTLKKH